VKEPKQCLARVLTAALAALCAANVGAGQSRRSNDVAWVGLFNRGLFNWLENVNRLDELCGPAKPGSVEFEECRTRKMAQKVHVIRLFRDSTTTASSAGAIVLVATPTIGLRAFFVPNAGGAATEFKPDLFDADWGYGPYFHETFLERRGTWFLLPERPFLKGSWFNSTDLESEPEIRVLEPGEIVTGPQGDLYILAVEPQGLRVRPEQDADMWCGEARQPTLKPFKEVRIPYRQLYNATGHLLLHVKYTRGC